MNHPAIYHHLRHSNLRARLPLRALRALETLGLAVVASYLVVEHRRTIVHTLRELGGASPGWVVGAVVAELISLILYAVLVRRVLVLGGARAPLPALLGYTVVGIAMLNSLPAGQAVSSVYWFRVLRRHGAERSLAAVVLLLSLVIGVVTLVLLAAVGLIVSGGRGPLNELRTPLLVVLAGTTVVPVVFHHHAGTLLHWLSEKSGAERGLLRHPRRREVAALLTAGYFNWAFDCLAFALAIVAVHGTVPWHGLIAAYALGQLVSALPLLPGGGGTVEASLAFGLAAYGGHTGALFAGVVLFRLLSAWGLVPIGWLIWARGPHHVPEPVVAS